MAVSKEEYSKWEQEVINNFYDPSHITTPLVPDDGSHSVLRKVKVLVVLLARDGFETIAVERGAQEGVQAKVSLQLFHIGKRTRDGVSYGLTEGEFKHPACDVGGLTNYKQRLGHPGDFIGDELHVPEVANLNERADILYSMWQALTGKVLPDTLRADLEEWLASARDAMGGAFTLRFHKPPEEHRTIVTSADVMMRTGRYYERVFGGDSHAKESTGDGLFCGITDKFITPNLNMNNINLEYCTYAAAASPSWQGRGSSEARQSSIAGGSMGVAPGSVGAASRGVASVGGSMGLTPGGGLGTAPIGSSVSIPGYNYRAPTASTDFHMYSHRSPAATPPSMYAPSVPYAARISGFAAYAPYSKRSASAITPTVPPQNASDMHLSNEELCKRAMKQGKPVQFGQHSTMSMVAYPAGAGPTNYNGAVRPYGSSSDYRQALQKLYSGSEAAPETAEPEAPEPPKIKSVSKKRNKSSGFCC